MTLVFLLFLLLVPYLVLTMLARWVPRLNIAPSKRARIGVSLFFVVTAIAHFVNTREMAAMVPPSIPYPIQLIYLTGVLELLGAIGVWIPRLVRLTGFLLILMLVCLLPANIYSAINRVDYGGHGAGITYLLVRMPFQLFVMWWTYFATEQSWFQRRR